MAAVYPNQYKSFPVHRNLIEDIDASHVNQIQEEVAAIQQTLGLNPHKAKGLKAKVTSWSNVGARLDAIQRGQGVPVGYLYRSTWTIPSPKSLNEERYIVPFPAPSSPSKHDPEGMYNGQGFTLNRTGWWLITGYVRGAVTTFDDPLRFVGFNANGVRIACHDGVPNYNGFTHTTATWQGVLNAGTKIDMVVRNYYKYPPYPIYDIKLSVSMLREL